MSKTIINREARHSLVPMGFAGCTPLRVRGIAMAGISSLCGRESLPQLNIVHHRVLYTIRGSGVLHCGRHHYSLQRNSFWIVPAAAAHTLRASRSPWELMWFCLRPTPPWNHLHGQAPQQRNAGQAGRMVHVMIGLMGEMPSTWENRVQMGKMFSEVLSIFLERRLHEQGEAGVNRHRQMLAELWEKVDANLSGQWTVETLAQHLHVSAPHLHRIVQKYHKTSPIGMVIRLKLHRAEELLVNTDLKLDAIATYVGYQSGFALSKAFKRQFKISPERFRRSRGSIKPK